MATDFGFEPKNDRQYLFVSYNSEDAERIAPIVMQLYAENIPLWYDRALRVGGESWQKQIAEKIDTSEGMLLFITKGIFRKAKSSFAYIEYQLAKLFSNVPIYVVLLDEIELNEIPLEMRVWWLELTSCQCIPCYGNETDQQKSMEIIRNLKFSMRHIMPFNANVNKYTNAYSVDIVFCISASASMDSYLEAVKNACVKFPHTLLKEMNSRRKEIRQTRVRVIRFGNYAYDKENAITVSDFFNLSQSADAFEAAVRTISLGEHRINTGSGNALEALTYAIRSKWDENPGRKRQVIILWTNEEIVPLGAHSGEKGYPAGMASDIKQLRDWWYQMDQSGRRLIIFAPNHHSDILYQLSEWDRSIILPISLSSIGEDHYADISRMISASI